MHTIHELANDLLPGLQEVLTMKVANHNLYKSLECLVDYTKSKIKAHDYPAVKQCFAVAQGIYEHGNLVEKNAVETIFVYSFSSFMIGCDDESENHVQSLMPGCLRMAYVRQMVESGI